MLDEDSSCSLVLVALFAPLDTPRSPPPRHSSLSSLLLTLPTRLLIDTVCGAKVGARLELGVGAVRKARALLLRASAEVPVSDAERLLKG